MSRIVNFFDGAQSETTPTIGNIVASGLVVYASGDPIPTIAVDQVLDPTDNSTFVTLDPGTSDAAGNGYTANITAPILQIKAKLKRTVGATGTVVAKIYATAGNSVPTTLLATSNTINVTTIDDAIANLFTFIFPSPYTHTMGTDYVVIVDANGVTSGSVQLIISDVLGTQPTNNRAIYHPGAWTWASTDQRFVMEVDVVNGYTYDNDVNYELNETGSPAEGNIYFNSTLNLIRYYNGAEWISVVDESTSQTLTNKSMDGDLNIFTDIDLSSLKTQLADANKFIVRNALGQVVSLKTVPVGEVVGTTDTQTLTNKTVDADQNTITNISNDEIKVGAAIDADKLADGSVSNTELQYINSLTSNAQDQIDSKIPLSQKGAINGVAELDGTGKVPASQLTVTAMELQGFFNPNTTTLVDGVGSIGDVWEADTAGSRNFGSGAITFAVNDWAVYAADNLWHKSINSNQVTSVAGKIGTVTLEINDMTDVVLTSPSLGQIIEFNGTNWINVTPSSGVTTLDGLTDVVITTPVAGQKLQYNGTNWVNVTDNLDSLSDTIITTPTTNEVLTYNGTNWVNSAPSSGNLDALTDVIITTPTTGTLLRYNGTDWVNSLELAPVFFTAVRLTDQTGVNTNNTEVKVTFNSTTSDSHSAFNTSTNRYVVPTGKGGRWIFFASVAPLNTNILAGRYNTRIYNFTTGSNIVQGNNSPLAAGVGEILPAGGQVINCADGDEIEVRFFGAPNNSGSTLTIQSAQAVTFFSGHRIGN